MDSNLLLDGPKDLSHHPHLVLPIGLKSLPLVQASISEHCRASGYSHLCFHLRFALVLSNELLNSPGRGALHWPHSAPFYKGSKQQPDEHALDHS